LLSLKLSLYRSGERLRHPKDAKLLSGFAGKRYDLAVWNPSQIASVRGGKLEDGTAEQGSLTVAFPAGASPVSTEMFFGVAGTLEV
jgi:hypothetical protein